MLSSTFSVKSTVRDCPLPGYPLLIKHEGTHVELSIVNAFALELAETSENNDNPIITTAVVSLVVARIATPFDTDATFKC